MLTRNWTDFFFYTPCAEHCSIWWIIHGRSDAMIVEIFLLWRWRLFLFRPLVFAFFFFTTSKKPYIYYEILRKNKTMQFCTCEHVSKKTVCVCLPSRETETSSVNLFFWFTYSGKWINVMQWTFHFPFLESMFLHDVSVFINREWSTDQTKPRCWQVEW